ncbi:hypothetical protein MKW94_016849 [Papaver nudicaule]|uniref:MINDY deubiquitinase domain-containing protein n=1 Tax=Papaver nudicaule TaxID=74823 RepID=A0AA41SCK5_PAPNU|nr:hypothetical protein [Papaver nudicaule]
MRNKNKKFNQELERKKLIREEEKKKKLLSRTETELKPDDHQSEPDDHQSKPDDQQIFQTKLVKFKGYHLRIVMQDENGPCPLIAICNVLILKRLFYLDSAKVSAEILLSHVANRLCQITESGYHRLDLNQALEALPRFRTGIDVNITFDKIDGFVDTPELGLFRLLKIPLYHGWMIDPQDSDTRKAFGSKPYNTVIKEVADFRAKNTCGEEKNSLQEDCGENQKGKCVENQKGKCGENQKGKGDLEEEVALLQALELSIRESPLSPNESASETNPSISESAEAVISNNQVARINEDRLFQNQSQGLVTIDEDLSSAFKDQTSELGGSQESGCSWHLNEAGHQGVCNTTGILGPSTTASVNSSTDVRECVHNGEEYIPDSRMKPDGNLGPVDGEVVVAKQVEKGRENDSDTSLSPFIIRAKGLLMDSFLENTKNQLTIYGLFALQDGLKDGELCIFFRNNHFNTMLKHDNELYVLATDQGYVSQPDLMWWKLNEVNGDTVFYTGDFAIFRQKTLTNNYLASSGSNSVLSNDKLQLQPTSQHALRLTSGPQVKPDFPEDIFDDAEDYWNDSDSEGSLASPPIKHYETHESK